MHARAGFSRKSTMNTIDERLYGSFVEHLGRAVYTGIYEPDHPLADKDGFRRDVLEAVASLRVPIIRYPGGNFVSGYRWEDGIGPKDQRPARLDLAWGTVERNQFGVDEMNTWIRKAGSSMMMAVNLGTRGPEEAGNLVEYCNLDTPTAFAELRRKNGHKEPFGIKTWCLGNEMDGDWQICKKTAPEYARIAAETAKVMKWTDPSIELVVCGSSSKTMPTFGTWEETVLRECWDHVEYISLHSYYGNPDNDTRTFLASSLEMESFILEVAAICTKIKEEKKSDKDVHLSFDEWNIWFHSKDQDKEIPRWSIAPPLLEDNYTMEDALVVGTLLNTLIRNADKVKIACLAQLVNVIAPIMTVPGGQLWHQTIFYPFLHASTQGRGKAIPLTIDVPTYGIPSGRQVPYLDACLVYREEEGTLVMFAVNRHESEDIHLTIDPEGFGTLVPGTHTLLRNDDPKARNTPESPLTVVPTSSPFGGSMVVLPPFSWNVLQWNIQ